MKEQATNRETMLSRVSNLLARPVLTREDVSRANLLMELAERMDAPGIPSPEEQTFSKLIRLSDQSLTPEQRDKARFMQSLAEVEMTHRDTLPGMGVGTGSSGGYLVPQGFLKNVFTAMKAYDAIWGEDMHFPVPSANGAPMAVPMVDFVANSATQISEMTQEVDNITVKTVKVALPTCPSYRTSTLLFSIELVQDSAFPIEKLLAAAFGIFFARGISPDLITALVSGSVLGATATGDQNSGAPSGKTQIGYQDLVALRTALDPAYRALGANWLMNDTTLGYLDGLVDKNGRPVLRPQYDDQGRRILMGYPLGICPSLPNIGASAKPILFGATKTHFAVRTIDKNFRVQILHERYAEYLVVGFRAVMRAQGAMQVPASPAPQPCIYLQNAAA